MLEVFIEEENQYFKTGLLYLLNEIMPAHAGHEINLVKSEKHSKKADIIILSFFPGSHSLCHTGLMQRKEGSLLIGIYSGHSSPSSWGKIPHCFDNSLFIHRNEPIETVINKILFSWFTAQLSVGQQTGCNKGCQTCHSVRLSYQEFKVIRYISSGFSILQIASILGLSTKTISTHKRAVMKKLAIKSNAELIALCNTATWWNKGSKLYFSL